MKKEPVGTLSPAIPKFEGDPWGLILTLSEPACLMWERVSFPVREIAITELVLLLLHLFLKKAEQRADE